MPQSSGPTSTRRYSVCTQNETSRPLERRTQVDIPGGEANVTSDVASINSRIDQQRSTPVRRLPPARIVFRVSRGDVLGGWTFSGEGSCTLQASRLRSHCALSRRSALTMKSRLLLPRSAATPCGTIADPLSGHHVEPRD